jgi:hypothetical protein
MKHVKTLSISIVLSSILLTLTHAAETDPGRWYPGRAAISDAILLAASSAAVSAAAQDGGGSANDSSGDAPSPQTTTYATLGNRDSGTHILNDDGSKKIWPHALPFFGQKVISLGYDLPDPFGLSMVVTDMSQSLQISNLRVSTGDQNGPYVPTPFVSFDQSESEAFSTEVKFDFWLFPFMNVYLLAGYIDGSANVPLEVGIEGALDFLGHGGICPDNPPIPSLRPGFCDESAPIDAKPSYYGTNYGIGTVLAGGWGHYFLAIPISYVYSDLSNLSQTIETLDVEILIGRVFNLKHPDRQVEFFIGGMYLDATQEIKNSILLPFSELDPSLPDETIYYEIHEDNTDKWNYIFGGQFQFTRNWAIQGQVGFGGSRDQITLTGVWRW